MQTITEKQITFITKLTGEKKVSLNDLRALRVIGFDTYEVEDMDRREASAAIDYLLDIRPAKVSAANANNPASEKQISYIAALAKKVGRTIEDLDSLTKAAASELITELKTA